MSSLLQNFSNAGLFLVGTGAVFTLVGLASKYNAFNPRTTSPNVRIVTTALGLGFGFSFIVLGMYLGIATANRLLAFRETVHCIGKSKYDIVVNGEYFGPNEKLVSGLLSIDEPRMRHTMPRGDQITILFRSEGARFCVFLRQDARYPNEFWVLSGDGSTTRIGTIHSRQLREELRSMGIIDQK